MTPAGITSLAAAAMLATSAPAFSQSTSAEKVQYADAVLDCVARMDVQTTWDQCRNLIFSACPVEVVGSDSHLQCLDDLRVQWEGQRQFRLVNLYPQLSTTGSIALTELLGGWEYAITQNCTEVGKSMAAVSAEAAESGCHVTELVGITAEFQACLDGRSVGPYCQIKEN